MKNMELTDQLRRDAQEIVLSMEMLGRAQSAYVEAQSPDGDLFDWATPLTEGQQEQIDKARAWTVTAESDVMHAIAMLVGNLDVEQIKALRRQSAADSIW